MEIAGSSDLVTPLLAILEAQSFGTARRKRLERWKGDRTTVNGEQLLAMVADVGKGRLAGRLAAKAVGLAPPAYVADAIRYVVANV